MGCGVTTIKIASIVFNSILAVLGFGTIIWLATNPEAMREPVAIAAYIACSLIIVFAILGIYAAFRESICLTATCAVFLLLLSFLHVVTILLDLSDHNSRSGLDTVNKAWQDDTMSDIQTEHECCGKTSVQDYILLNQQIPPSCYLEQNISEPTALFLEGCISKLQLYYNNQAGRFAAVSWLLAAFEFLGFLLALFLVINFRNTQRRMQF